ncbi:MAG: AP2 domain-containing protein [Clostridium cadaveris]|uniref:AP2 domain-containing protein n=1 Tax=Clostridium cadaveris TaxID=1529 RepID=A0A316M3Z3_9CLOT|nr:MAG: AP2 domain-containing protein [Clostridium cadaveris]
MNKTLYKKIHGEWKNMSRGIKKDIDGQRFGMLEVKYSIFKNGKSYCYCKCDCGNEKLIRKDSIISGKQKSCGCLKKNTQYKSEDITGKKYSMLTPLKCLRGEGAEEVWLCKCDCGNEVEVVKKNIYGSSSISCGCKAIKQKRNASKRAQEKLKKIDWKEGTSLSRIDRDKLLKNNTSGITGVTWNKTRKRWVAQIVFKNQYFMLGRFKNKEDAIAVRKEAEKKLFKPIIDKYKKI